MLFRSMDGYKNQVLVPDMLVKLKQGFGRLIRTESDSGVCAILDSRTRVGAAYHNHVLNSLPACHVTSNISDTKSFIANKKPPAYFAS